MSKDLEYFKDFLENPVSYNNKQFHSLLREFAYYINEHKDEFNYLEDEEWREIRERVLDAIEIKEKLKEEFEEIKFKIGLIKDYNDADKITVSKEWLAFMKRNQAEYDFPDENIAAMEARLNKLITSVLNCEIADAKLKESEIQKEQALKKLDDALFEHYERTGKRPILTSLQFKKNKKGN